MKKKRVLIACKIFEEEINFLLQKEWESLEVEVIWVNAGLHADLALLEKELSSAIDNARAHGKCDVRVLFGQGCLPQREYETNLGLE